MRKMWGLFLIVALLGSFMMLSLTGCSDDDPVTPEDYEDPVVLPANPDALMMGYRQAYDDMDHDLLATLIHPDFKGLLTSSTLEEWGDASNPLPFTYFERDTLLAIHGNIFSGEIGRRPDGNLVPPVDSVEVALMNKASSWEPIPTSHEDFGGLGGYWALYDVRIYFNHPDQARFQVQENIEFYVTAVDNDGVVGWQILGWRELENRGVQKATESVTLGGVLTLYR